MALFGRGRASGGKKAVKSGQAVYPLVGKTGLCRFCNKEMPFTKSWRRAAPVRQCPCCGTELENIAELYTKLVPSCPRCEEPLEQVDFDYGFCDGCGSKYEIMEGTKSVLLPNQQQRDEMNKYGRVYRKG